MQGEPGPQSERGHLRTTATERCRKPLEWPLGGALVYNFGAVTRERTIALQETFPGVT
jgi:hypothetical protein